MSTRPIRRRASGECNGRPSPDSHSERCRQQQSSSLASRSPYLAEAERIGTSSPEGAAYAMAGALKPFDTCDSVLRTSRIRLLNI